MATTMEKGRITPRRGVLFVLSSPSGAGKSTLARRLLASDDEFRLSVSATTRPARPGEVEGKDYFFVSEQEFAQMVSREQMLEHARVFGNLYGTPRAPVEAAINSGQDVLFDVDWQGAQQLRASDLGQSVVSVFILPPSIEELERRLRARAKDSDAVIARRMRQARAEISHWAEYDYVLINDDIDLCYSRIETIIRGERLRWRRQAGALFGQVNELYREFEERTGEQQ
ncbi:MAG: guanylate kinase [Pseudomonadota bacterium]